MTQTWTLRLRCPDCGAVVTWENERPDWQEDEELVAEQKKARAWMKRFDKASKAGDYAAALEAAGDIPWLVDLDYVGSGASAREIDARFIPCPTCGGQVFIHNHAPTEALTATAAESSERKAS